MAIESKYKTKIVACVGGSCPIKSNCKLWYNLNERNIMEKIKPPYKKNGCVEFKQI